MPFWTNCSFNGQPHPTEAELTKLKATARGGIVDGIEAGGREAEGGGKPPEKPKPGGKDGGETEGRPAGEEAGHADPGRRFRPRQ